MKTLKDFRNYCGGTLSALVNPVKNQAGEEMPYFFGYLRNVSESPCGAAAGFTGFIYYSETVSFWRAHRKKIYAHMSELADELGENVLQMVCNFGGLKDYETEEIARALYGHYDEELTGIYNVFAWFALEEVANAFSNYEYETRYNDERLR